MLATSIACAAVAMRILPVGHRSQDLLDVPRRGPSVLSLYGIQSELPSRVSWGLQAGPEVYTSRESELGAGRTYVRLRTS